MRVRRDPAYFALRKQPVQDRSQARLDRIIAVAEEMILQKGLVGLSIREVAARADTNIATFYQFFPSRGSLTRHIVELYNARFEARIIEAVSMLSETADARTTLAHLQAAMVEFYENNPVTLEIWPGVQADHALRQLDQEDSDRNAAQMVLLIRRLRPEATPARIEAAADLMVLAGGPIFRYAVRQPPEKRRELLAQQLEMITALVERA
jgi:AcrR family transcriptional regulator